MQKRTQRRAKAWSRAEKALIGTFAVFALLGTAGLILWQNANAVPVVRIPPPPPPPNPNAYDFYVRAANLARITVISDGGPKLVMQQLGRPATRADEDAELARNRQALQTLRQGFAFSYQQPRFPPSSSQAFGYSAQFRSMARLLAFEARVKSARGDHGGAASSCLDALHLGGDMPRGATLIGSLIGNAVAAIGRSRLWDEANRLSAAEARAAARRLENIVARRVPYADVLTEDKWQTQAELADAFRRKSTAQVIRDWTGAGSAPGGNVSPRDWLQTVRLEITALRTSKQRVLQNNAAYMDALIARARRPYALRGPEPPVPDDPINQIVTPVFSQARLRDVNHQTANALLLAVFALRAYRAEHDRYPARLDELVGGGYLSKVPDDPCAPSGPVRYRLRPGGQKYLLYSVGADGKDDNGRPVNTPLGSNGRPLRAMQDNDQGDYVVGVNAR